MSLISSSWRQIELSRKLDPGRLKNKEPIRYVLPKSSPPTNIYLLYLHIYATIIYQRQTIFAFVLASLLLFSSAISFAWTSPSIPLLMYDENAPFRITSDEGSWIVAIYVIGTIAVPIPAAFMMDR